MKAYLLNPRSLKFCTVREMAGCCGTRRYLYYPIWLSYATGVLEKRGIPSGWSMQLHEVDESRVIEDVKQFQPDLIVVDTNFSSLDNDIRVANTLKQYPMRKLLSSGHRHRSFPIKSLMPESTT
jgi:CheY-like chemotaxis protein